MLFIINWNHLYGCIFRNWVWFGLVSYEKTDTKQYEIIELAPAENGYCAITKNNGKIYMLNYSIKVLEEVEENPHIVLKLLGKRNIR